MASRGWTWAEEIDPFLERLGRARHAGRPLREYFRREIQHVIERSRTEPTPEGTFGSWWGYLVERMYAALPSEEVKAAFRRALVDLLDSPDRGSAIGLCARLRVQEAAPRLEELLLTATRPTPASLGGSRLGSLLRACAALGVMRAVPILSARIRERLDAMRWPQLRRGRGVDPISIRPFVPVSNDMVTLALADWEQALPFLVELLSADMAFLEPVGPDALRGRPPMSELFSPEWGSAQTIILSLKDVLDMLLRAGGPQALMRLAGELGAVEPDRRELVLTLAVDALRGQQALFNQVPGLQLSEAEAVHLLAEVELILGGP